MLGFKWEEHGGNYMGMYLVSYGLCTRNIFSNAGPRNLNNILWLATKQESNDIDLYILICFLYIYIYICYHMKYQYKKRRHYLCFWKENKRQLQDSYWRHQNRELTSMLGKPMKVLKARFFFNIKTAYTK